MLTIAKLLTSIETMEQYKEAMAELRDIGQYNNYIQFMQGISIAHRVFESEEKLGNITAYENVFEACITELFTTGPAEAFPLDWLSVDKTWMTVWLKQKDEKLKDIQVKVSGKRVGMRVAIFREIMLRALSTGCIPNLSTTLQTAACSYFMELSGMRFNQFFVKAGVEAKQGVNCLYTGVRYFGVINDRKQAMIEDRNYKGIPNLYIRRNYVYLLREIYPDACAFYSA